jgi:alpha-N-arabinofuranosidase
VLSLANLAQIVNVLQSVAMTDGQRMWLTPTYHVLRMHAAHLGAAALPVSVEHGDTLPGGASTVTATASRRDGATAITVINRHISAAASVRIGGVAAGQARAEILAAESASAHNSADDPARVAPAPLTVSRDGDDLRVELPPHSLATIVVS